MVDAEQTSPPTVVNTGSVATEASKPRIPTRRRSKKNIRKEWTEEKNEIFDKLIQDDEKIPKPSEDNLQTMVL